MNVFVRSKSIEKIIIWLWILYVTAYVCVGVVDLVTKYPFVRPLCGIVANGVMIALCIIFLCTKRCSLLGFLGYVFLMVVVYLIEINATSRTLLMNVMFMLNVSNVNISKLMWIDFKLKTVLLFLMLFLCACGVTEDVVHMVNGVPKHSMGTINPNILGAYLITILLEWLCLHYGSIKKYQYVVIAALSYIVYIVTMARTSVYTFWVVLLLFILADRVPEIFQLRLVKVSLTLLMPAMSVLSFWLTHLYANGNMLAVAVNRIMTGRLRYAAHALSLYQPKIIGQRLEGANLDSGYISGPLIYGVLFMVYLFFVYAALLLRLIKYKKIGIVLLSVFYLVSGLAESYMYNVIFNLSMMYLLCSDEQLDVKSIRSKKFKVCVSDK